MLLLGRSSSHWIFWEEAICVLQSMKFVCKQNKVVSIKNWILTIKGFIYLSKKLLNNGFDFILLRNFNQDPIENFFCSIRSHGIRNINPTCANFISSFKSLLISNLTTKNSVGANCEDDNCDGILSSLKDLLLLDEEETVEEEEDISKLSHNLNFINPQTLNLPSSFISNNTKSFVTGWIVKKIKPLVNNCKMCKTKLTSDKFLNEHNFIKICEYEKCNLIYPTTEASNLYGLAIHLFNTFISDFIEKPNIKKIMFSIMKNYIDLELLSCPKHDLQYIILNTSIRLLIFSFVSDINLILNKGEKEKINTSNQIKIAALKYHKTYKQRNRKICSIKLGAS